MTDPDPAPQPDDENPISKLLRLIQGQGFEIMGVASVSPATIYVMPSEEGLPPRALLLGSSEPIACQYDGEHWVVPKEDEVMVLPDDIGRHITDHAQSLGVDLG